MKSYLVIPWLLLLGWTIQIDAQSGCEFGWSSFRSKCYRVYSSTITWTTAQEECQKGGANLPSIRDEAENKFVHDLVKGQAFILLGGTYLESSKSWTWVDGSKWAYENWQSGQPSMFSSDQKRELCMASYTSTGLGWVSEKWHDYKCDSEHPFNYVCSKTKGYPIGQNVTSSTGYNLGRQFFTQFSFIFGTLLYNHLYV